MTDWIEAGSFGAAAAAVAVAFYSVWAGYRNQLRAADREQRRTHYASFLVAISNLLEDFKELDENFQTYWTFIQRVPDADVTAAPAPGTTPTESVGLVLRLKLWVESALGGVPIDSTRIMADLTKIGLPTDAGYVLESVTSLLARVSTHGNQVHQSSKVLALSGTPVEVRKAANSLTNALTKELEKLAKIFVNVTPEPRDWDRFARRMERLEELMKKDIGQGTSSSYP